MPDQRDSRDTLKVQLEDLRERFPRFRDDDLFVLWFLLAYLTEDEEEAARAVAGGARDKGVDALLIDDRNRSVFVVQGKYRYGIGKKSESRSDLMSFAQLATTIADADDDDFAEFANTSEGYVHALLREARRGVREKDYRLSLFYVTLGRCSPQLERDAQQFVRRTRHDASLEVISGKRFQLLLDDYLDGVAPPIPIVDLEMEAGEGVRVNGVLQRFDSRNQIESWVFSMPGSALGTLVDTTRKRIFARNIRGFMGENTSVNRGMTKTLKSEPNHFFYYNNGVTIVCDHAEKLSSRGRDVLRVGNPQIINGQQTSRMLAANRERSAHASVLVKVIHVPRDGDGSASAYESLISRIVASTNWQNAIRSSDLMANDRRQIELERSLRKLGYMYLRKRQTKVEAKLLAGGRRYILVKKEDLAQAVAGCDLDPIVVRLGKDNLFTEDLYPHVFPTTDPNYYLTRFWLMQDVTSSARGIPQRGYAKWLVLGFMWSHVGPIVRAARNARAFRLMHEHRVEALDSPLTNAIDLSYKAALRYYNAFKGSGSAAVDISRFFKGKRGRDREFREYWQQREDPAANRLERLLANVRTAVATFEE